MTVRAGSGAPVVTGGAAGRPPCPILLINDLTIFPTVPGLLNPPLGHRHPAVSVPCRYVAY